jgi:hypothetical protein
MTLHKPLLMQPASGDADLTYTGSELRALVSSLWPYEGVIRPTQGGFAVTQRGAGANLSVDVAAGMANVQGDDVAGQNMYTCWSDATVNLVLPAAPGSGTRNHRVGLRIRDKLASGAWTTYEFLPDYVADTGAGLPAEPVSFLTLAQASISAGQSSYQTAQITDLRVAPGWVSIGLAGSWTNITGFGLEARLNADDTVSIHGMVSIPSGTIAGGNAITGTFTAPYRPSRDEPILSIEHNPSTYAGTAHTCILSAAGVLSMYGTGTSGNRLSIQARYPLHSTTFP